MRFSAVVAPKPSDCRAIAYGLDAVVSGTAFQVPAWDELGASPPDRWLRRRSVLLVVRSRPAADRRSGARIRAEAIE